MEQFGAHIAQDGLTEFRVWAPSVSGMEIAVADQPPRQMDDAGNGWKITRIAAPAGTRYRFRLPSGTLVPDPASRLQDSDIHGASVVVDHNSYQWQHNGWCGRPWHEAVVYELHAGIFGGFNGVRNKLPHLKKLGITAIELMPVADFPGPHNWGYDGVLPFAPDASYGSPDELKQLIDTAHGMGIMVFLDVVYNHFGPDGNYLHAYAEDFFRNDITTPWGAAIDFRQSPVRNFFIQNALMWLMDYRFDGLRFDAVSMISETDFLDEMAATIRQTIGTHRHVHLILENENNSAELLRRGYDAQWTDDWHHCIHVMLTGEAEGYYSDFITHPAEQLARCCRDGFAYQGEISPHSGKPRGEPSAGLPTSSFLIFLQNHDQIGNRALGERLTRLTTPKALRAATAFMLLSPFIPMLFMGEEIGTTDPFLFFTSHNEELAELVRNGRREEFKHFAAFQDEDRRNHIPDPNAPETFAQSIPNWQEADPGVFDLYRRLLAIRSSFITPGLPDCKSVDSRATGPKSLIARWHLGTGENLILACNLGHESADMPKVSGVPIFETEDGSAENLQNGTLPPFSTVALIVA